MLKSQTSPLRRSRWSRRAAGLQQQQQQRGTPDDVGPQRVAPMPRSRDQRPLRFAGRQETEAPMKAVQSGPHSCPHNAGNSKKPE
ncbi:unnamed protein product [Boreogadus saida]